MMSKLDIILLNYKIYPNYKGYAYIKEIIKNQNMLDTPMMSIYNQIAKKFNKSWECVERNIRTAIDRSKLKGYSNKKAIALIQLEAEGANCYEE